MSRIPLKIELQSIIIILGLLLLFSHSSDLHIFPTSLSRMLINVMLDVSMSGTFPSALIFPRDFTCARA